MKLRIVLILLFCNSWLTPLVAQLKFSRISTQRGLSQSTVGQIFQDKKGFIWFATKDGLNKYDGYQFTVYRHISNDPNSISSSTISCITEDQEGNLWVGTFDGGVNKLDKTTGNFIHFKQADDKTNIGGLSISSIIASPDNKIWVSTYGYGLLCFDNQQKTIKWRLVESELLTTNDISLVFQDKKNTLWLGGHYGVITHIDKNNHANTVRLQSNLPPRKNQITCLVEDPQGKILVGTRGNGLYSLNPKTNVFTQVLYSPNQNNRANLITDLVYDKDGTLWIGTDNGVFLVKNNNYDQLSYIESNPDSETGLSSHAIQCIFVDRDNNVWISTWEAGLNVHYRHRNNFKLYRHKVNSTQNLLRDKVTAIACENDPNRVWIGSNNGLTLFDRAKNTFSHYFISPSHATTSTNDINNLYYDNDGDLSVLTWEIGLRIMKKGSNSFILYPYDDGSNTTHLTCLSPARKPKHLWIGTQEEGILLFNKQTGEFSPVQDLNRKGVLLGMHINSILEEENGTLWIGTYNNGIYCYNQKKRQIVHIRKSNRSDGLSANQINKIFQDSRKQIWIGTNGGGLNLYQPTTRNFKVWRTEDGLPNNTIKGIVEDHHYHLWLSTNQGISQFITYSNSFKNYTKADGLQGSEFLLNAYAQNNRGEIFFGGTEGLNIFHPDSLIESNIVPNVYITGLKLFNKYVVVGQPGSPLQQDISQTEELELASDQNVFSIDFTALDFQQFKNNQYAYVLQGFDKEWNYVGTQRTANYTNLNAGSYLFRVKATNNDGVWNQREAMLHITILPPWYRTWWAYFFYLIIVGIGLYFTRRVVLIRERLKLDVQLQEREKEQVQELDRLKTNFFTNISHEFRTPLTLIISPLEKYLAENKDIPDSQRKRTESIYRNAKQLQKLINQLLDLSKLEAGKLSPEITQNDVIDFIQQITESFRGLAEQKNISLLFKPSTPYLLAYFDTDILEKIVTNLLSNAFKFSDNDGEIVVKVSVNPADNQRIIIAVSDTGIGIDSKNLQNVFNRFYQIHGKDPQKHVVGTGVGLALCKELIELHRGEILVSSRLGKGSTFTIHLPINKDAYDSNWIRDNAIDSELPPINIHDNLIEPHKNEHPKKNVPLLLIAEDNDDLRNYIKEIFVENFNIIEANNGQKALDIAIEQVPDLIISDWIMPEMTGGELCEHVKTKESTSHIPVIILTSRSSNESKLAGLEIGADDYITKPFNASLLEARVKNLLESRKKLRERFSKEVKVNAKEITLNSSDEHFLEKAVRIVEENMMNTSLDIAFLERELNMSTMQLYRKLKSLTNFSGNEFIKNVRLKKAIQLLETDSFTIAEIAYKVGFNDPSYFTRIFKKEFGKSPSEYLEKTPL
ncbi:two-component regulator propeller domain-containing protein [Arcicella aquatica]|uniref:histidine kinase n=1 Tax=Arcicella aquatica TaxID=217141 RepID=A0ABU5QJY5_9BACT|nr:two-component regulator propeller domain-containing protein [Arcicella aquatica]MEA5257381.1 two-component regulator propeller domain-containing protein [Arcicella aquatica]